MSCPRSLVALAERTMRPIATILLACVLGGGCLSTAAQPSVILVSIDTLRADHLSAYGYRKIRTPNIDSFAEHGSLLTQAEAQVPLTRPRTPPCSLPPILFKMASRGTPSRFPRER